MLYMPSPKIYSSTPVLHFNVSSSESLLATTKQLPYIPKTVIFYAHGNGTTVLVNKKKSPDNRWERRERDKHPEKYLHLYDISTIETVLEEMCKKQNELEVPCYHYCNLSNRMLLLLLVKGTIYVKHWQKSFQIYCLLATQMRSWLLGIITWTTWNTLCY